MFFVQVFLMLSRLFIAGLCSPAGNALISWLLLVMFIVFLLLSHWYPGSGVTYLIVLFPDLLSLSCFVRNYL